MAKAGALLRGGAVVQTLMEANRCFSFGANYQGFFRFGLASAMFGGLKRAGLHFLHPSAYLSSRLLRTLGLPAVGLETVLSQHCDK